MNNEMSFNQRQELVTLLQNHSNLRTGQDQVLWSIFGAFWTANSLLLVSIFTADSQWNRYLIGFIVSLVGVAISRAWHHIQNRALFRIEKYEAAIIAIEEKLHIGDELCSFFKEGTNPKEMKKSKKTARYVMKQFSRYSVYVWFISSLTFLGLFIFSLFCHGV